MFWKFIDLQRFIDGLFDGQWVSFGLSSSRLVHPHDTSPQPVVE